MTQELIGETLQCEGEYGGWRRWGKVLRQEGDEYIVYWPNNPKGERHGRVKVADLHRWLSGYGFRIQPTKEPLAYKLPGEYAMKLG